MQDPYLFYKIMKYPPPFQKEFFAYEKIVNTIKTPEKVDFSWAKQEGDLKEYLSLIHKYGWLWKSLPFIDIIYLSGSITFNALQEDSDIDLFVISSPGRIRLARAIMTMFLGILGVKRTKKYKKQRFCLNFFVSRDSLNLHFLKLSSGDPYFIYRLAHLVPLYQRFSTLGGEIYENNYWLREYLPSFPMEQAIFIGNKLFTGITGIKKGFEKIFGGMMGNFVEQCIRFFVLSILLRKKKKKGKIGESIILSDTMLKFHADKRKEYAVKWKVMNKNIILKK